MSDSWLLDVSWVLLAAMSIIVLAVGVAAFGRDLLVMLAEDFPQISNKNRAGLHH